jgi:anaerobic magnesium-protoporphyrin IX monomethyl ester cyclase
LRVLFIYPNLSGQKYIQLGIAYLSGSLKAAGHEVGLFDMTWGFDRKALEQVLLRDRPDLVGVSVRSTDFEYGIAAAEVVKACLDVPIAFGGAHATVDPEGTLARGAVDMVCVGEGEEAVLELAQRMDNGEDYSDVQSFWFKRDGQIIRNPVRPLLQELDRLPYPDRSLFDPRHLTTYAGMIFISGRGCPYRCSYCINHRLLEIYKGKGRFVRFRSTEKVIDEIKETLKQYPFESLYFGDEAFTLDRERTRAFCEAYAVEVGIPFSIMTRADLLDDEMAVVLKKAGCQSVGIGIEAGNDTIRNEVLRKKEGREVIVAAFRGARAAGLSTYSFNMVGIPGETKETIMETVELNRLARADVVQVTIFAPFKGTALREVCEKEGYIREEPVRDYYTRTFLELPTLSPAALEAYHKVFWFYCRAPRVFFPLIHGTRILLEKLPASLRQKVGRILIVIENSLTWVQISGWRHTLKEVVGKRIGLGRSRRAKMESVRQE